MAGSLTDQLKPAEQLREIFNEIKDSAEKVTESYSSQLKMIKELVGVLGSLKPKDKAEEFKEMNETVQAVQKNVDSAGDAGSGSMKKLGINVDALEKKFGKVAKASIYTTAVMSGLKQGIKNVVALSKSFLGLLTSASQGIFRIGTAIVSIPFKMFKGLIAMAQEGGDGMNDLLQEIENVRKQFGQFGQSSAKAVLDVTKTMGGFSETGLSTWRVFGTLAERMAYIRELATGMGVAWSHMVNSMDMKKEGGHILAYQKGLGLAAEQMKAMYDKANAMGKPITALGVEMTKYSYAMAKQFGLSAKEVSRDVGKAMQDVKHFGQLTIKEINVAATYARKLNIEFEKITGTLDAFDTFDSAADNAAKLAQSFGMNVDSFKMMEAQNPAERLDMLRKAMFAAGKDADKMNRQELKLLATSTGLDEATTKQAFSFKNQGVSLDEVKKKANATENAQMSQAEAMKTLAGAIERMVKSGSLEKMTGFFDAFVKGMLAGVRSSPEFIKLMRNVKFALYATWMEGRKLGFELIKLIPGMKDFFDTLTSLFEPKKYRENAAKVSAEIRKFFTDMTKGPFSFEQLMNNLRNMFFNFFNNQTPEGRKVLSQIKNFFLKLGEVAGQAMKYFGEKIATGLLKLAEFIKDPSAFLAKAQSGGKGAQGFIMKMFGPMIDSLKNLYPLFKVAVKELFGAVWGQIQAFFNSDTFKEGLLIVGPAIAGIVFGPVVMRLLAVSAMNFFSKILITGIETAFESGGMQAITKFASSKMGAALGLGASIGAILAVSLGISAGVKKFKKEIRGEFTDAQTDVAAGVTGMIDMITLGLMPDWLLVAIANWGAKIGAEMQKALNKAFAGLGDNIMGYMHGYVKFFGGIGDVILGILSGDADRVMDGLWNIIVGGFMMIIRVIQLQFVTLPLLLAKIIVKVFSSIYSTVMHGIGKVFDAIGLGELGKIFHGLGDLFKFLGKLVGNIYEFLSSALNKIVSFISDIFNGTTGSVINSIGRIMKVVVGVVIALNPFYWILKGLGALLLNLGEVVISRFVKEWTYWWPKVSKVVSAVVDEVSAQITALAEHLAYAADYVENLTTSMSSSAAEAYANQKRTERFTAKKSMEAMAKKLVAEGKTAVENEADKQGGILDSLLDPKTFDVKTAPTKAINFATQAVDQVEDIKKKLEGLSIDKLQPIMTKVSALFAPAPEGIFMKFVEDVNKNMSGTEMQKTARSLSSVSSVFESLTTIGGGKLEGVVTSIDAINKLFSKDVMSSRIEGLLAAMDWATAYGMTMNSLGVAIKTSGVLPALEAVQKMVAASNELDKALSDGNIKSMNVKTKLQNVANAVGLGGKANYEIKNRGVNIHLDIKVEINAADMEKAMIMRAKSIVRDRLNKAEYSNDTNSQKGTTSIPERVAEGDAPETYFAHPSK